MPTVAPTILDSDTEIESPRRIASWRALNLLNNYRLLLSGIFLAVVTFGRNNYALGDVYPELFFNVSVAYAGMGLTNIATIRWRILPFRLQVYLHVFIDIVALTVLMHASGSIRSGLGFLLVVAIAGGSLLIAQRSAILFAAVASIALLIEQFFVFVSPAAPGPVSYTQAGMLGITFFVTATVARILVRRIRESEALAQQRGVDLANMEQLTEYVVQRMQTGIIVIDAADCIRLINESAWSLLGKPDAPNTRHLHEINSQLADAYQNWKADNPYKLASFRATHSTPDIIPRFARLGKDSSAGTLIFIEDTSMLTQQAQQLKLASLGRLSASIAHEIRNPLAAISHAGQLLNESSALLADRPEDQRLINIILDHCKRVNNIIENILQLSRRQPSQPQEISLLPWITTFVEVFSQTNNLDRCAINIDIHPETTMVYFDASHLHQVLVNLCDNALRYTTPSKNNELICLSGGKSTDDTTCFIDVIDFGKGISAEVADNMFEPFFTTDKRGTGLGLYICRELCEFNHSRLHYDRTQEGCTRFRITFADSRRSYRANYPS